MIKYQEILRLYSQGVSQRGIAAGCQCLQPQSVMCLSEENLERA